MLEDLGWMNNWKITPRVIVSCRARGHHTADIDVGPPLRGMEHVVKCLDGCAYIYRYDSSD